MNKIKAQKWELQPVNSFHHYFVMWLF